MITGLSLNDPARNMTSVLKPRTGVAFQGLEFTATVREVIDDLAEADGALDTTSWLSAGAVTLNLALYATTRALLDEIHAFLVPWARPYLVVTDSEWGSPRQVQIRFDSAQHPIELARGGTRYCQYAWKAPRGLWEDTAGLMYNVAASVPDLTGFAFTAAAGAAVTAATGYRFPASMAQADTILTVTGNARPAWKARLYGPATGPKLSRDDTGQTFNFTDQLTLPAGGYVELDSAARSANYLSDPAQSMLSFVDFTASEWFPLDPGPNKLRYHATTGTAAGSVAQVIVSPVWMP